MMEDAKHTFSSGQPTDMELMVGSCGEPCLLHRTVGGLGYNKMRYECEQIKDRPKRTALKN